MVDLKLELERIGSRVRERFDAEKRVLSFTEYLDEFAAHPFRHSRDAARYLHDCFDFYGTYEVARPYGKLTRFKLFDLAFERDDGQLPTDYLVGHENIQQQFYRALGNFVREGRANRLLLLHGPNGSAKSTFVACLARALEHYSQLDEGALYRFNWVFPTQKASGGGIGFGQGAPGTYPDAPRADTFAYLADEQVDARLGDELRDHPLFLIPQKRRAELLKERLAQADDPDYVIPDYVLYGELSHKNRQVYEALLTSYRGDWSKVLRHVQVERFYLSRRYREAAVTVEPQMHVDARMRQISADRSLGALPPALQSMALFEASGELVDANRGLIEYSDLLKRPLEAYKYLLGTVEHGEVGLDTAIIHLDLVFIGSSNESHLAVFKEVPEFQSFKGRMELIRVPYILDYTQEKRIYDERLRPESIGKHVAPHVTWAAAVWSVLTRMRKPLSEKYPKGLAELVGKIGPLEKAELYATGSAPEGWPQEQQKDLVAGLERVWSESDAYPNYEGRSGASPREMQTLILNAAANPRYACLSPSALFDEMDELVKNVTVHEFLKQEPLPGGFHENKKFIQVVRERYLDVVDDELRVSMGLVDESEYVRMFERYVANVTHWIRKEKVRNPVTGRMEEPDEEMMSSLEKTLGVTGKKDEFRGDFIQRIGAWSIDHPGQKPALAEVFPKHFNTLRESYFEQSKKLIKKTNEDLLILLTDGASRLTDKDARERAETTLANLKARGYCDKCAKEAAGLLMRKRYAT